MGFVANAVNSVARTGFRALGGAARVTARVAAPVARVAAPVVGAVLGGPAGAAIGGGIGGLLQGGNRHDILRNVSLGAATSGLGASAGERFGAANSLARYLGGSSAFQTATTALGAGLANTAGQNLSNSYNQLRSYGSAGQPSSLPISAPTFEELRSQAEERTQEAFEHAGLPRLFTYDSPFRKMISQNRVDIYNTSRFPSLKKIKEILRRNVQR
jgi:hypothetical protein